MSKPASLGSEKKGERPNSRGPESGGRSFGALGRIRWSLVLICFGFVPLVAAFFLNLWKQPEYQFFPQALAGAGFLAWDRLREVRRPMVAGRPLASAGLFVISLLMLALAVLVWSPWLATVAVLPAGVAIIWGIGGAELLKKMFPALLMVLTIIPPPLELDVRLGLFLREVATTLSSRTLDFLGVVHSVTGNVIELPGQKLLVEEACSGINSVLFVTAFCLFYLLWRRRTFWCFVVCLPAALGFVVMGNVVRISLGAVLRYYYGIDILTGWKHESLSIVLTAVYVLLVISLESLFPPVRKDDDGSRRAPSSAENEPLRLPVGYGKWAILFAVLGMISSYKAGEKSKESGELRAGNSSIESGVVFSLPEHLADWTRTDAGPPKVSKIETLGLSSVIWNYRRSGLQAVVAFDYPIWRYHDVALCYTRNGWAIESKDLKPGVPQRFQMEMKKEPDIRGSLWFATFNEKGEWVDRTTVESNFANRFNLLEKPQETTFRVQLLLVGSNQLDPASVEAANRLFDEAAALLSSQVLQHIHK